MFRICVATSLLITQDTKHYTKIYSHPSFNTIIYYSKFNLMRLFFLNHINQKLKNKQADSRYRHSSEKKLRRLIFLQSKLAPNLMM